MSTLPLKHIKTILETEFSKEIDMSDVKLQGKDRRSMLMTRSLSAFAVSIQAGIPAKEAAECVVDGFNDNGIDAIFYDRSEPCLYLVQSKWSASGKKGVPLGEINKFLKGAQDLIDEKFNRFNDKVKAKMSEIQDAFEKMCKCRLVLSHTSTKPLSKHVEMNVEDFLRKHNIPNEDAIVEFVEVGIGRLHGAARRRFDRGHTDLEFMLHNWGHIEKPYLSYYGTIEAEQVAEWWMQHGNVLFVRNLRRFLGDTEINDAMNKTLKSEAENFWYFNNGITILCSRIQRSLPASGTTKSGAFKCFGASVVNGAQTVGCIGRLKQQGVDISQSKILIRIFSLKDCPPNFSQAITRATNTQNKVESKDFAALDLQQDRIARELKVLNVDYSYKRGEQSRHEHNSCDVDEAIVSIACASLDLQLGLYAKRESGKLWESDIYPKIFNEDTSGAYVWQCVTVKRIVDSFIYAETKQGGLRRQMAIHGNRFILRQVFRLLRSNEKEDANTITRFVFQQLLDNFDKITKNRQISSVFKSKRGWEFLEYHLYQGDGESPTPLDHSIDGDPKESPSQQRLF